MGTTAAFTAAGTTLGVSASPPATENQAGWEGLTFTNIGEIVDFGEIGRVYNEITHNPVGSRETFKFKGSYNDGNMQLQVARAEGVVGDAGLAIIETALDSDSDFYFAIELNDNPSGSTNTILYFPAKVMSAPNIIGGVDSIVGKAINVAVSGSILTVDATAT